MATQQRTPCARLEKLISATHQHFRRERAKQRQPALAELIDRLWALGQLQRRTTDRK
jgi:hypothetical protein